MTDRLRIFDRKGFLLVEFNATVTRSWVIGERTTASFTVPVTDDYCNGFNLNFGNWVLVEHDTFPAWVGTIASRDWGTREVTIAAFSPEFLIGQRIGPVEKVVMTSAGGIFAEIIEQVNAQEMTILRAGNIYKSDTRQETLNPTPLSDDLDRVYKRSREEYTWRAVVGVNGNLLVYGDWTKRLGREIEFTLYESSSGGNIEAGYRVLAEDAPEGNYVLGYGNGLTWQTKPLAAAKDTDSISKYGLIQKSISYYGVTTVSGVSANALGELAVKKHPGSVYNVNALNSGDTYQNCKLGNIMRLRLQNIGFTDGNLGTDTKVRVVGMMYDPKQSNKIELALEVVV